MGSIFSRTANNDNLEVLVRLQHGMTGPNPKEIHTILKYTSSPPIIIYLLDGLPSSAPLTPLSTRCLPISETQNTTRALADIRAILEGIPTERPRKSEDIYGEDIALRWESEEFVWFNGGPEKRGVGGKSWVQPTEKEKEGFKRAIEIVRELVARSKSEGRLTEEQEE